MYKPASGRHDLVDLQHRLPMHREVLEGRNAANKVEPFRVEVSRELMYLSDDNHVLAFDDIQPDELLVISRTALFDIARPAARADFEDPTGWPPVRLFDKGAKDLWKGS
jgi:hypothetical protein